MTRQNKRYRPSSASSDESTLIQATESSSSLPVGEKVESKKAKFDRRYKVATTSPEDVLELQKQSWSSAVYAHYLPPEILHVGDVVKYVFVCKKNPSEKVTRARHDESTSNLVRHAENCDPSKLSASRSIATFAHGSTYNPGKFRLTTAIWIARRHRPFNIVEDPEFIELLTSLNNKVNIPSRFTVSRDIEEIFQATRKCLAAKLQAYDGKLHLCIDGWTSPNVFSFIGITVHWVEDGSLQQLILDFIRAAKSHTGAYLAARISECLHEFGIQQKILATIMDNASNNTTLLEELPELIDGFQGTLTRIRCFAHILNLVVKAILSQFYKSKKDKGTAPEDDEMDESDDEEECELDTESQEDPEDELDGAVEEHDAEEVANIISELELAQDDTAFISSLTSEEINLGQFSIAKLTNLGKKVFNSSTLRSDLKSCCERSKIPPLLMIRAVKTRWNTMAKLIGRALKLREPLTLLVNLEQHNKGSRGVRLQRFKLSKQEWDLLGQLYPLLEVFLEATKLISQSNKPLLHHTIPVFDIITRALDDYVGDDEKLPAVRAAARRGRAMLNKYYGLTDESIMYRIAMLLHPRYKSNYFISAKWEREWIAAAEGLLRDEWEKNYKKLDDSNAKTAKKPSATNKYFIELENFGSNTPTSTDPVSEWLSAPPIPTVRDPIAWWTSMNAVGHPLARMALDFLSAPATSTDVERAFSRGGLTVSKMRHSLSDSLVRSATVLGSWCEHPKLIPSNDLVNTFNDKHKRPKAGKPDGQGLCQDDSIVIE